VFVEGLIFFDGRLVLSDEAKEELEYWVVPAHLFRNYALPSKRNVEMFRKHCLEGENYITMESFVESCNDCCSSEKDYFRRTRIASALDMLIKTNSTIRIDLFQFCLFHLLIPRSDAELDILFLLMNRKEKSSIDYDDFTAFLETIHHDINIDFDLKSDFVKRYFEFENFLTRYQFSQFFVEFQREMGRQRFLQAASVNEW